jgi:nucleotide-binding universal stress UspA family protein
VSGEDAHVRRVLVALDASPHSLAALQAAVALASARKLELVALFVEDLRLLQATALPFAREVGTFSGVARPLDVTQIERRLHDLAVRVESLVAASASRAEVRWSFRVRRGDVASEILACAEAGDVLSLGAAGWSPMRGRGLGDTAGRLLRAGHGPMLLARHGARLSLPLLVLLEGGQWERTLELALALAGSTSGALVLAVAPGPAQARRAEQAQALLAGLGAGQAAVRLLAGSGPAALRAVVRRERAGALILPVAAHALEGEAGELLLATFDVPVILVRPSAGPAADATPAEPTRPSHDKSPLG